MVPAMDNTRRHGTARCGLPFNAALGRDYRGLNIPLLWAATASQGYSRHAWISFKQARGIGGSVRKGVPLTAKGSLRVVSYIYDYSINPTTKSEPYRWFDADCRDIFQWGVWLWRGMSDAYCRALYEAIDGSLRDN